MLNTKQAQNLIENNNEINYANLQFNYKTNIYKINSTTSGCNFNLISKNEISSNNKKVELSFTLDSEKNKIIANCNLKNKSINCNINKEIKGKYKLKDYLLQTNDETLYIIQEEQQPYLELDCSLKSDSNSNSKLGIGAFIGIFFAIFIGGVGIILAIILVLYHCVKNSQKKYKNQKMKKYKKKKKFENSLDSDSSSRKKY